MPTQQHIEYYRNKHQKFTNYKLQWSMLIATVSNFVTAPFEQLKVRAQLLQEGRRLHGYGLERGVQTVRVFNEIIESGHGVRSLWKGYDSLILRGIWYGGWRSYFWCLFFNHYNKDPRRTASWPITSWAGFLGGFCAGVITNPIDIIYNRQVADGLYPKGLQRNYTSFLDGLQKIHAEGALLRGAMASGLSYGLLVGGISNFYDYMKEYFYWWFGPTTWLRPFILIPTTALACALYLPFDNIKTRFHTMTPLPNGEMPYKNTFDAFFKIFKYEASTSKYSSVLAFANGGMAAFWKLFISLYIGINLTDIAFRNNFMEGELWETSTVYNGPQQGYIPHEPYFIDEYQADVFSPIRSQTKKPQIHSLGPGTQSYIKY